MPKLQSRAWSLLLLWLTCACSAPRLERVPAESFAIPLPGVSGRIDHLAYSAATHTIYVAALAAGQLLAVDVGAMRVTGVVSGLAEPQGIAVLPGDRVVVACGGDGSVRGFTANGLTPLASCMAGADADNVRLHLAAERLMVGVQDGVFVGQLGTLQPIATWPLPGHAESFQIDSVRQRVYVNVPDAARVMALDLASGRTIASARPSAARNYPMALDAENGWLLVGCREPAGIAVFAADSLRERQFVPAVGDMDDLFIDERSRMVYAIGGEGFVDRFAIGEDGTLVQRERLATRAGSRTGLWISERSELWVAVPQRGDQVAELRCVLR